MSALKILHL